MQHNYDNDPNFLDQKEWLVNFKDNFPVEIGAEIISAVDALNFFEANIDACMQSNMMQKIKRIFRENKNKLAYFKPNSFNIAIHIRRPNSNDNRVYGTDISEATFLNLIYELRERYCMHAPTFHIYSQGAEDQFEVYKANDVILHLNESVEATFSSLVLADVLATSPSSFSYTAALLSEGEIYYMPFWHPALSLWKIIEVIN